jgi:RNA polymerase sigma-70 factor (ECF subfamily)
MNAPVGEKEGRMTQDLILDTVVAQAQRGDLQAFEEIYRAHAARVYTLCLRLTAEAARAEELTQDAFIRIWQKLPSFRGESAFTTWLHRLTVNVVIDRLRSDGRKAAWLAPDPEPAFANQADGASPPSLRLDLEKAIASLPSGARAVFTLHDIEGYRHGEIAAMTGISEGTSKAQLHRARRLLREKLER